MKSSCLFTILLLAAMFAAGPAGAANGRLRVSAVIPPFLRFNAVQNVTSYEIKSADIERGYLDLPNAVTVSITTNLRSGIPVAVENLGNERVVVKETGATQFNGSSFTASDRAFRPNTPFTVTLDSRILLSSESREGRYPLKLSVTPSL